MLPTTILAMLGLTGLCFADVSVATSGADGSQPHWLKPGPLMLRAPGGLIATPVAAAALGDVEAIIRDHNLALHDGLAAIRFGSMVLVATEAEARAAFSVLRSPSVRRYRRVTWSIGDLGFLHAAARDVEWFTQSARVPLSVAHDGWFVECFDCVAADVISALVALGAKPLHRRGFR